MNWGAFGWLFRAVRARSLTFAVLFAVGLLGGFSITRWLRSSLASFGFWFPLVWLAPVFLCGWLARHESRLPLRPEFKRRCAFLLVFGALTLTALLWRYQREMSERFPDSEVERGTFHERRRGPRGR